MAEVEQRLDKVEARLGSVEKSVKELRDEVGELRGEVEVLHGQVGGLAGEVYKLRVLAEANESQVRLVAEVQAEHGRKLEALAKAVEPIARIDAFIASVAGDHEVRIKALEKHTGTGPS
jgi:uncharacterized coiled-coil protein SlyX